MNPSSTTIGILGAGKVGIVLAQLALKAGYKVLIANSKPADSLKLTVSILAPGAEALDKETVAKKADIVILALPLSKFRSIPTSELRGKLIIDAMNHWYEVDGPREDTLDPHESSTEAVQHLLPESSVVKALSHMGYHELFDSPLPAGSPGRKAVAIAGDNEVAIEKVSSFINRIGFDPLVIGDLAKGRALEPGMPAFGASAPKERLEALIKEGLNSR